MDLISKIGFWKEFYPNPNLPTILDDISNISVISKKSEVLKYLEEGYMVLGTRHMPVCPITNTLMYPQEILTDGVWIWTSELIYYFEQYDISIEARFIEFIEDNNYKYSKIKEKKLMDLSEKVTQLIHHF